MKVKVLGMDPSLSNWGIVHADLDIDTLEVRVDFMKLIETEPGKIKQVRKNSDDISRAQMLHGEVLLAQTGSTVAFCEVPHGSQSARAMASYGICVGVLGGLRVPLIELSASEVKLAALGFKTASKEEMIEAAVAKHPDAPWIKRGGKMTAKNEHLADALFAIYAGIQTPQFATVLHMLRSHREAA